MTGRLPGKRERTRGHIASTAHTLFERHGFAAVTMEQIAVEAGVVRGTLYNHFPVKEAVLVEWMHARLADDLQPLLEDVAARPSFPARIATLLEASAQWWEQHRQYAAPYIRFRFQQVRDGNQGQGASAMTAVYSELVAQAQKTGEVRDDEPSERLANYLHFLSLHALMTWLGDGERSSLRDEYTHAFEFFMQGAAPR